MSQVEIPAGSSLTLQPSGVTIEVHAVSGAMADRSKANTTGGDVGAGSTPSPAIADPASIDVAQNANPAPQAVPVVTAQGVAAPASPQTLRPDRSTGGASTLRYANPRNQEQKPSVYSR